MLGIIRVGFNIHSRPPMVLELVALLQMKYYIKVLAIPIEEHYSTKSRIVFHYVGGRCLRHTIEIDNQPITFGRGIDLLGGR